MKKVWFMVLVFVSSLFVGPLSVSAVMIDLLQNYSIISVGDPVNIDIVISGLDGYTDDGSGGVDLSSFNLTLNYDESFFSFTGYSLGTQLGDIASGEADDGTIYLGSGQIYLYESSWLLDFSSQPDSFELASVFFTALLDGSTSLSISDVDLGDYYGNPIELEHSAVPVPPSILLLSTGIMGLGIWGRRKNGRHF